MGKLNLEEFAEIQEPKTEQPKVEKLKAEEPKVKKSETEGAKQKPPKDPKKEIEKIFALPFEVAMQNLGVDKSYFLEVAEQMFVKGFIEHKEILPYNNYIILTSKRASEEMDMAHFILTAIEKQMTSSEFEYLSSIRNLAAITKELKFGEIHLNFANKTIDEKFEELLKLPSPVIAILLNKVREFQGVLLLLLHPKAIDFLSKHLPS